MPSDRDRFCQLSDCFSTAPPPDADRRDFTGFPVPKLTRRRSYYQLLCCTRMSWTSTQRQSQGIQGIVYSNAAGRGSHHSHTYTANIVAKGTVRRAETEEEDCVKISFPCFGVPLWRHMAPSRTMELPTGCLPVSGWRTFFSDLLPTRATLVTTLPEPQATTRSSTCPTGGRQGRRVLAFHALTTSSRAARPTHYQ